MQTIRIRVNDSIYDRVLVLLKKFRKGDIEVIEESTTFLEVQSELKSRLKDIDHGKEKLLTLDEFENKLNLVIAKNEGSFK